MFEVNLTLKIQGAEHEVVAEPRDLLTWEKTSRGKKLGDLLPITEDGEGVDARRLSLVEIYRLAHITATRLGIFTGPIQQFEDEATVILHGGRSPDPTHEGQSDGPASNSPSNRASRRKSGRNRGRGRS